MNHYCSMDCYSKNLRFHGPVCKKTKPVDWQASRCVTFFENYWFQQHPLMTRVYQRIHDILKMHYNADIDFECDESPGDMGYKFHRRGCGHTAEEADLKVKQ